MTDEDESTDPRNTAAEREILKFLGVREPQEQTFDFDGAGEDGGTPTVNQLAQHPAPAIPIKQRKTAEELAAMSGTSDMCCCLI
jgi:hypothetical protein